MHTIQHFPARLIEVEGQTMTYFGGTSYLGMASLPAFQALLFDQIRQWGTAYGSSRNANVQLAVYAEAEQAFATFIGAEEVICLSSGMLAGQLVLETLTETQCDFFHYPQTHPAIKQEGSKELFVEGDLHPALLSDRKQEIVICVDTMPALFTTPVDLGFLAKIHPAKEITLLLDESHALGIIGKTSSGLYQEVPSGLVHRKIAVSSLGKALGLAGGLIGSDKEFAQRVRARAKFVSASAANPAYLGTFKKASKLYNQQREVLHAHLAYIDKHLKPSSLFAFDKAYPVLYCKESTIADVLFKEQIVITKFRYPTYTEEMLRIVISAHHQREDIHKLINIVNTNT